MTKTEMLETMKRLDAHANALLLIGASDIDLLGGMFDVMPDFKALLDAGYGEEIERNAGRFPGLHRYAVMLSNIAEGIADGSIRVPRCRHSRWPLMLAGAHACEQRRMIARTLAISVRRLLSPLSDNPTQK